MARKMFITMLPTLKLAPPVPLGRHVYGKAHLPFAIEISNLRAYGFSEGFIDDTIRRRICRGDLA